MPRAAWQDRLKAAPVPNVPPRSTWGNFVRYISPLTHLWAALSEWTTLSDPTRGNHMDFNFKKPKDERDRDEREGGTDAAAAEAVNATVPTPAEAGATTAGCSGARAGDRVSRGKSPPGPKSAKMKRRAAAHRRELEVGQGEASRDASPGSAASTLGDLSDREILGPIEAAPIIIDEDEVVPTRAHIIEEADPGELTSEASSGTGRSRDNRGRRRKEPAEPGRYKGLYRAREESRKLRYAKRIAQQEEEERETRREVARIGSMLYRGGAKSASDRSRSAREERSLTRAKTDPRCKSAQELSSAIGDAMGSVEEIVKKSGNLKCTFVRDLKGIAVSVREHSEELHIRAIEGGDTEGLRAENVRLRLDNEGLKNEILHLKASVEALKERLRAIVPPGVRDIAKALIVGPPITKEMEMGPPPVPPVATTAEDIPAGPGPAPRDGEPPLPQRRTGLGKRRRVTGRVTEEESSVPPPGTDPDPFPISPTSPPHPKPKRRAVRAADLEGIPSGEGIPSALPTCMQDVCMNVGDLSGGGGEKEEEIPRIPSPSPPASPRGDAREEGTRRKDEAPAGGDILARLEDLITRKLGDFRREILAEVRPERPKPLITRVETLVPPGGGKGHKVVVAREGGPKGALKGPTPLPKAAAPKAAKREGGGGAEPLPSSKKKRSKKAASLPPPPGAPPTPQARKGPQGTAPPPQVAEEWAQVVGRKERRKASYAAKAAQAPPPPAPQVPRKRALEGARGGAAQQQQKAKAKPKPKLPRTPTASAITLTRPEGCELGLDKAMEMLRSSIKLEDFGISGLRPKRAVTGALLLEVPGDGGAAKAEALASRMTEVLAGTGVKVTRPVKRVEVRVSALPDDAKRAEVGSALASAGGCPEGDIRIGEIRKSPSGLGTVWCQIPLAAARRVTAASEKRSLVVGWAMVRAEVLATRPLQCYRCLEIGHPRQRCTGPDRSGRCYRCGREGHSAASCEETPQCPLCTDLGRPANHRLGAPSCAPQPAKRRGGTAAKSGPKAAPRTAPAGAQKGAPVGATGKGLKQGQKPKGAPTKGAPTGSVPVGGTRTPKD